MSDSFERDNRFKPNAGLSRVVFGSQKPLTEMELNESQLIQSNQLKRVIENVMGDGISDDKAITYENGVLTVGDCFFSCSGFLVKNTGLSIALAEGETAYLRVWEEVVTHQDTLKEEGNEQSEVTVENTMLDETIGGETTRRTVVKYNLFTRRDTTKANLAIATVENGALKVLVGLVGALNAKGGAGGSFINIIRYPYLNNSVEENDYGVKWVENGDGTITANGTNTGTGLNQRSMFICRQRTETNPQRIKPGTYTLTGCPKGGSTTSYLLQAGGNSAEGSFLMFGNDTGDGLVFTVEEETELQVIAIVNNGATVKDVVFKPMLVYGESPAPYYVPYHFGGAEDAKMLSGHIAPETLKTSILEKALEVEIGIHNYIMGAGSYTGGDLPNNTYRYGMATIFKRSSSNITVVLWGTSSSGCYTPATNLYNGTSWHGWDRYTTQADLESKLSNYVKKTDLEGELEETLQDYLKDSDLADWAKDSSKPTYTASEVGLGNVPNVATNDQTPTYTVASADAELTSGEKLSVAFGKIAKAIKSLISHLADTTKHITSSERTAWNNKAGTSTATTSANGLMSSTDKNKLDGIASGANAYTHPNSGVTAGTYHSVTVNAQGHVTAGSNPTVTVAQGGTGATTAKGAEYNVLGGLSESTEALTDSSRISFAYESPSATNGRLYWRKVTLLWNYIKSKADSVYAKASHGNHVPTTQTASNKVFLRNDNTWQTITPANIGASATGHKHTKSEITDFPSSLPASDVYSWAKASSKPSYSWSEIGSKPSTFTPSSHKHPQIDSPSNSYYASMQDDGNFVVRKVSDSSVVFDTVSMKVHKHYASDIVSGTFGGAVVANATAVATLGTKQVRNIYAGTTALVENSSTLPTGDIYIMYE